MGHAFDPRSKKAVKSRCRKYRCNVSTRKTFNKRTASYSAISRSDLVPIFYLKPFPCLSNYPLYVQPSDSLGLSRRTRTNVTRASVTLIRFQCKTYDPPIMVRSHLPVFRGYQRPKLHTRDTPLGIIDIDWCRRTALIALQTLPAR